MRVRDRVVIIALVCAGATAIAAATPQRQREQSPDEQVRHVLSRLAFGPRPGDVDHIRRVGVDAWIESQLHPDRISDTALERFLATYEYRDASAAELRRTFPPAAALRRLVQRDSLVTNDERARMQARAREARDFLTELHSARVARAVASERQLAEVMTDFWLNHFSVYLRKNVQMRYHVPSYEREVIRPRVLGPFRDLLGAVTHSPAMLIYLDNAQSIADSLAPTLTPRRQASARRRRPGALRGDDSLRQAIANRRPTGLNENYARELLELHTLGVDGGYTQDDVGAVARALTGWGVRPGVLGGDVGFRFTAAAHDAGAKTILGTPFPAGRGEEEGEAVLDLLARHPATAQHIARKLATRFVSDSPPQALVDRAAAVFLRTEGDMRAVVRTIVTSPEFFSRTAYRAKVKSPFETAVSALRALGAQPDSTALTARLIAELGQPLYGRQTPDGWPETAAEWMNTGAILRRINFGLVVASGRVPGAPAGHWPGAAALAQAPRAEQVRAVTDALFAGEVSEETREILRSGSNPLLEHETPVERQSRAQLRAMRDSVMAAPRGDRTRSALRPPSRPLTGLAQVVGLALGAPEFQRR